MLDLILENVNTMARKHHILTLFLLIAIVNVHAASRFDYWRSDSLKVTLLLQEANRMDANTNWMLHFARKLCGLPYVAQTLEKNTEEKLVINLRQMDCTTYAETVTALTLCIRQGLPTFKNYCHNLQQIRYINGEVSYPKRLHYFTLWVEENKKKGLIECIEEPKVVFSSVQTVNANYMSTHPSRYPMLRNNPEWIPQIKAMEDAITGRHYSYIPKEKLKNTQTLRQVIHNGDIVVILTSKLGLDTSHLGIAVWHKNGLHLLNASSIHHRVAEEQKTFYQYMREHPSNIGIRVVRVK